MIILEEDYDLRGTIVTIENTKAARATPHISPSITVQLKPPVIIQTYQPWPPTTIREGLNHDYKEVACVYQLKGN